MISHAPAAEGFIFLGLNNLKALFTQLPQQLARVQLIIDGQMQPGPAFLCSVVPNGWVIGLASSVLSGVAGSHRVDGARWVAGDGAVWVLQLRVTGVEGAASGHEQRIAQEVKSPEGGRAADTAVLNSNGPSDQVLEGRSSADEQAAAWGLCALSHAHTAGTPSSQEGQEGGRGGGDGEDQLGDYLSVGKAAIQLEEWRQEQLWIEFIRAASCHGQGSVKDAQGICHQGRAQQLAAQHQTAPAAAGAGHHTSGAARSCSSSSSSNSITPQAICSAPQQPDQSSREKLWRQALASPCNRGQQKRCGQAARPLRGRRVFRHEHEMGRSRAAAAGRGARRWRVRGRHRRERAARLVTAAAADPRGAG